MSAVTAQEIVSLIEGIVESDACMGSISDKQVVTALEVVSRIKQHGIAPPDCITQADEETHRRVDEAVRNGRIEDRRAEGEAMSLSREEITRMAREAGWNENFNLKDEVSTRIFFANADSVESLANAAYKAGAASEREACARLCDDADKSTHPSDLADTIRARGNGGEK